MIHGLDTGFLVAAEVKEHADHSDARAVLTRLIGAGDQIAIAPQVLAEFIHVATDSRRFTAPLDVATTRSIAEKWWTAAEVVQVFPTSGTMRSFFDWLAKFSLGRKRLLDTLLSATYYEAGVKSILTTNPSDFSLFGGFTCIMPKSSSTTP